MFRFVDFMMPFFVDVSATCYSRHKSAETESQQVSVICCFDSLLTFVTFHFYGEYYNIGLFNWFSFVYLFHLDVSSCFALYQNEQHLFSLTAVCGWQFGIAPISIFSNLLCVNSS